MVIPILTHKCSHNILYGLQIGEFLSQAFQQNGRAMFIGSMLIMDPLVESVEMWIWIEKHEEINKSTNFK